MERPLPRRRAPLLARRRRAARRDRDPDRGLARRVRARRGAVEGRQFRRRPRRLHPRATSSPTSSKHNEANGEHNRDGTDNNLSWNHGVEGPSDDPAISRRAVARRAQSPDAAPRLARNADALAWASELGFSQGGNNNAYAQDNATSAIDWRAADASLIAFTARLIKARRAQPRAVARRFPDRSAVRRERPLPTSNGATPTGR